MTWTPAQIPERLHAFRDSDSGQQQWETDYSRLLNFVCANLDEAYEDLATSVEDCDSEADTFHSLTGNWSVIDVKQALNKRFKPEHVARLGNEHVIYPSLSRRAYEQLIEQGCARYAKEAEGRCGLRFELPEDALDLYAQSLAAFRAGCGALSKQPFVMGEETSMAYSGALGILGAIS
ncbi:hypothetical protein SAMN05216359_101211 [Roseateles sp. YR242]|uniref:hypothetical protein n=1 Tax=Roseateles sp. YR242 TaxID=1855305 RepID=UPI0008BA27B9|nr:hypothetical protein [Roseateles sp. YR242]SEK25948.1 hypothetical protein SAMN05216359_101211 [Roseateles sp. YR242]